MQKRNDTAEVVQDSAAADREIVISRLINAPQALVFEVWTDPKHIAKWWGPDGFSTTDHEMDVRPGGSWRFTMHGPGGMVFPSLIRYQEVVRPEKLAYTYGSGQPNDPGEFHVTITFRKQGGKTLLTMHSLFKSAAVRDMVVKEYKAIEGGNQTINHFEQQLAEIYAARELVLTRTFDAPRDLVFKAWSEPARLAEWWGPKGFAALNVAKADIRPGGEFLYGMKSPDGFEMWGKFAYQDIESPARMEFVNSFSDKDGNMTRAPFSATWPLEVYNVLTLEEQDGKTLLTLRGCPINATAEEVNTFNESKSSLQQGFSGTFAQLDEYLQKNKQ